MHFVLLALALIVFTLVFMRKRRSCRWVRDRKAASSLWTCQTCGASSFSTTSGTPDLCKRGIKDRAL